MFFYVKYWTEYHMTLNITWGLFSCSGCVNFKCLSIFAMASYTVKSKCLKVQHTFRARFTISNSSYKSVFQMVLITWGVFFASLLVRFGWLIIVVIHNVTDEELVLAGEEMSALSFSPCSLLLALSVLSSICNCSAEIFLSPLSIL